MGPLRETKTWNTRSVDGVFRFLCRTWRLFLANLTNSDEKPTAEQLRVLHTAIKKVTGELRSRTASLFSNLPRSIEDTEEMRFNTAISAMMEFVNAATKWETCPRSLLEPFCLLLAPYAPHISEELWCRLGHASSLAYDTWPTFDIAHLLQTDIEIAVQVNGKLRGTIKLPVGADEQAALAAASSAESVLKWVDGMIVKRRIYVPGKLVNLVVAPK